MPEAGGARNGGEGAGGGGAKRRRRRRPKRASAQPPADTSAPEAKKTGAAGRGETGTSARSAKEPGASNKRGSSKRRASQRKKSQKRQKSRKAPAVPTKREISAGGVVYRRDGEQIEFVLASRRTRRGELAWGLAKGGIEDDESPEDAAIREVREETGLLAEIEASLGETRYFYVWENVRIRKTVHFFLMRHTGGDVEDRDDEMEEIRWFPLERALKRAAYRGERDVLGRAAELLR
jgi:8-oxo-dGTP pyrophosphatase MutT (NUDIX family)